jgi:hypothetical protein
MMLRGRRFRAELARPVSFRAAQWFRFLTVGHVVFAPPLMLAIGIAAGFQTADEIWSQIGAFYLSLGYASFVLSVIAATGVPSYFFHPKHLPMTRQNRGIALSYYACGPLALSLLAPVFFGAALLIDATPGGKREWNETAAEALLLLSAFGVPLGVMLVWWLNLLHLAHAALQSFARVVWLALGFPVITAALVAAIFCVVPLLVIYAMVLYRAMS